MKEKFILTGGVNIVNSNMYKHVHVYNETGFIGQLPDLMETRGNHGCGHFYNKDNQLVHSISRGGCLKVFSRNSDLGEPSLCLSSKHQLRPTIN